MRFCILFLCLYSSLVSASSSALHQQLSNIQTLQGIFTQTTQTETGRILDNTHGRFALQKPGLFRWEVLGDEPRLLVSNHEKIWDYDQVLEQVTVQRLDPAQVQAPIFFLSGDLSSLDRDFKQAEEKCQDTAMQCYRLTPKENDGAFQWVVLRFKAKKISEMEMLDQLGQHSQFRFQAIQLNEKLDRTQFDFIVPNNVDVLESD